MGNGLYTGLVRLYIHSNLRFVINNLKNLHDPMQYVGATQVYYIDNGFTIETFASDVMSNDAKRVVNTIHQED